MTERDGRLAERAWRKLCLAAHNRDGWRCTWCHKPVHRLVDCPAEGCRTCANGDHRIALAIGLARGYTPAQLNDLTNIVTSCAHCNNQRSHRQRLTNTPARPRRRPHTARAGSPLMAGIGDY